MALCPGLPVASAGPYASLHLAQDRYPRQHPTTQVFYRPDALPATQSTVSKHWRQSPVPVAHLLLLLDTVFQLILHVTVVSNCPNSRIWLFICIKFTSFFSPATVLFYFSSVVKLCLVNFCTNNWIWTTWMCWFASLVTWQMAFPAEPVFIACWPARRSWQKNLWNGGRFW